MGYQESLRRAEDIDKQIASIEKQITDILEQNSHKKELIDDEVNRKIEQLREELERTINKLELEKEKNLNELDKELQDKKESLKGKIEELKQEKKTFMNDILKGKLYKLQEGEMEDVTFSSDEWEYLKKLLTINGNCKSVKMQEIEDVYVNDDPWDCITEKAEEKDVNTILKLDNRFVLIHTNWNYYSREHYYDEKEPYYIGPSYQIEVKLCEKDEVEFKEECYKDISDGHYYVTNLVSGENELTESLDIEKLFDTNKRKIFEEAITKEDVFKIFLSQKSKRLNILLGEDVVKMIGYDQKNSHQVYDLWEHTLRTVEGIKRDGLTEEEFTKLRVAAFFHDIGKPDVASYNEKTGQQVYYGHAEHSVEVARPILEDLGYSEDEIKELSFYIGHHDDFISHKTKLEPWMKNHEFIREINPDTVSEIIIQNKYDFERMGYDKDQIRYICYTLGHGGETPKFMTKADPVKIDVDMDEVQEKIDSGEYDMPYVPTERDYEMLLRLCKADAMAQSEVAMQNGKKVGSKKEKLENMTNIENSLSEAYKSISEKVSEYSDEFIKKILDLASKRVSSREQSEKAKALLKEYESRVPKNNESIGEE